MQRFFPSLRLAVLASLIAMGAAGAATAADSVAITSPTNNGNIAHGSTFTVSGTCSGAVYRVEVIIQGTNPQISAATQPTSGTWSVTLTAPNATGAYSIQANGHAFPSGNLVATTSLAVNVN